MTHDQPTTPIEDGDDYEFLSAETEEGKIVVVARSQVWWVDVERSFLQLHTATGESYLWRGTLKNLEQRWTKHGFVRIHRSCLALLPRLSEPHLGGWGWFTLLDLGAGHTEVLPVGRKRVPKLKQLKQGPLSS
jgi:DNA-binding LytR/AlgR family response regulator